MYMAMFGNYTLLGLATWQGTKSLLYNFSSAQQNELKLSRLILSRRSASSESSPFLISILKGEFMKLYFTPTSRTKMGFGACGRFGMSKNHRLVYRSVNFL